MRRIGYISGLLAAHLKKPGSFGWPTLDHGRRRRQLAALTFEPERAVIAKMLSDFRQINNIVLDIINTFP